jgi:hypothetical protein
MSIIEPYRVVSQVPSYNHFALLVLVYHWFRASTLHGVGPLLSHVIMVSRVPSCIDPIWLSMRMSSPIASMINSVGSSYPNRGGCPRLWNLRKFLLLSELLLELLNQEDWVMKHATTRVMKHSSIQQGAMSPMHKMKSVIGDRGVFLFTNSIIEFKNLNCNKI